MPNHVTHRMIIQGPASTLSKFKQECFTSFLEDDAERGAPGFDPGMLPRLDFHRIIPEPEAIAATHGNPSGSDDWYNWRVAHWGTKWDAYAQEVVRDELELLEIRFDTAWSPPVQIFNVIAERYPELEMEIGCIDEGYCYSCYGTIHGAEDIHTFEAADVNDEHYMFVYGTPIPRDEDEDEDVEPTEPVERMPQERVPKGADRAGD